MAEEGTPIPGEGLPDGAPEVAEPGQGGAEAGSAPGGNGADVEAQARRMGWVPQEEFRGDPAVWRDAAEFVERGENILPIVRERLEKVDAKLAARDREVAELKTVIEQFKDWANKSEKRQYDRAVQDLRDKQRQAAESGDLEAFDRIGQSIDQVGKDTTRPPAPQQGDVPQVFKDWAVENPWFEREPAMSSFAISYRGQLINERPGMTDAETLKEVTKEVKRRFPEKFGPQDNPMRNAPGAVHTGGSTPSSGTKGRTYSNLPPEAKKACDNFVKQGLLTREQYLSDYEWEAD